MGLFLFRRTFRRDLVRSLDAVDVGVTTGPGSVLAMTGGASIVSGIADKGVSVPGTADCKPGTVERIPETADRVGGTTDKELGTAETAAATAPASRLFFLDLDFFGDGAVVRTTLRRD